MSAQGTTLANMDELIQVFTMAAMQNGNMKKARAELIGAGMELPTASTLNKWRQANRELYEQIRREVQDQLRAQHAEEYLNAAAEARSIATEMVETLRQQHGELDLRDLPGAIRNVATTSGIFTDKALALAGERQGGLTVNINLPEQVRGLAAEGARFYDESGKEMTLDQAIEVAGRPKALPPASDDGGHNLHKQDSVAQGGKE